MLRLLRNNLFLGNKAQKTNDSEINMCFICGQHIEKRISLLFFCEKIKEMTQYLIRVLKRSGFLKNRHQIGLFLFKSYKFNTIEYLTLATLWNYIYKLKFSSEKFAEMKFSCFLKKYSLSACLFPSPSIARGPSYCRCVRYGVSHQTK